MKKFTNALLTSALVVSTLGLAGLASAKPFGEGSGGERGDHFAESRHQHGDREFNLDRMAKRLNLSNEQRSQIERIIAASRGQMSVLRTKLLSNREQLSQMMQQSPLDEAAVRSLADAHGDLKADKVVLLAQQRAKINEVLTDEQRAKLAEMRTKKRWKH